MRVPKFSLLYSIVFKKKSTHVWNLFSKRNNSVPRSFFVLFIDNLFLPLSTNFENLCGFNGT